MQNMELQRLAKQTPALHKLDLLRNDPAKTIGEKTGIKLRSLKVQLQMAKGQSEK